MLVFLCFILFTFGAITTAQRTETCDPVPTCQENEHYAQESVSCQKTCLNYRLADTAGACKPFTGCECDDGFVRLYDDATGPCILTSDCDYLNCNDSNATYKQCPWACQPTCDAPDTISVCKRMCPKAGCECKPGYIRSENGGYCIRPKDCPGGDPCRGNQTFVACKVGCPTNYCPVDDRRAIVACSPPYPCPPGCSCKSNHLRLSRNDAQCVLASECPQVNCTRPNEQWNPCPSNCLAERCSDIGNDKSNCRPYSYCRPQCVCKDGFYRNQFDICIPAEGCLCQENEQYVQNSTVCQKTCGNRLVSGGLEPCEPFTGCTCSEGFVRLYDNATGSCIPVSECAPIPTSCGVNEEPTSCKAICPPQSCAIAYTEYMCPERQCEPGCNCIENYLRNSSEICILNDDCPPQQQSPENEHYVQNSTECQKTCGNRLVRYATECSPYTGYVCDDGYVRLYDNATGPCIPVTDCAPIPTNCGYNEEASSCKVVCPPQSCAIAYTEYMCPERQCEPGCNCIENYLRNSSEICIFNDDCPPPQQSHENEHYVQNSTERQKTCGNRLVSRYVEESPPYTGYVCDDGYVRLYDNATGPCILVTDCAPIPTNCGYNEEPTSCKITCPPESCDISYTTYLCAEPRCDPGCNCVANHLRNSSQICIPADDCPPPRSHIPECGANEISTDCVQRHSHDTCESLSDINSSNKRAMVLYTEEYCTPGCRCVDKYRRNSLGDCIPKKECPKFPPNNVHYVYNSTECQKTCGNRLVSGSPKLCDSFTGYVCDDGYVRTYDNATGPCILESDCEPIPTNCGLNEEASSCKVICPPQSCNISFTTYVCEKLECKPGCNCIENYLRNASGVCILNDDCFPQQQNMTCNGDRNATYKECSMPCQPTCDSPNAMSKCTKECSGFSCECQPGYILSARDGQCILPEDCPGGNPCGTNKTFAYCKAGCPNNYCPVDDSLAIIACSPPFPCPSGCSCNANHLIENSDNVDDDDKRCILSSDCSPVTCTRPNEEWNPCPGLCLAESCSDIGKKPTDCYQSYPYCGPKCVCKEGFYRNDSNICVPAAKCDGNPCGVNGTYSDCSFRCPNQYCPEDDSRLTILCKPGRPCPPGCMCKQDYLRISSQNDTCVLARDCPKIDCTRENEIWDSCSSECLAEKCEDMYEPNPCNADDNPGCKPRCVCAKGYFRDKNDACIPDRECPNYINTPPPSTTTEPCPVIDQNNTESNSSSWSSDSGYTGHRKPRRPQCIRTCAEPNPKNCRGAIKNTCKDGFIRSKRGGKCIKIEDCPNDIGCNGDKYAVVKACPLPCPVTCANPNYSFCKRKCDPIGCECKPGYLFSKENGKCILPDDCEGGNPCGPNGVFFPCKSGCPTDYCPVDDGRGRIICETYPFSPCYPGCGCKLNHKFKSREDRRCILSYKCPPVNCTRPFEKWSSCPSACLAENCEDVNNQPSTCNTLVFNCDPKCVCTKGHFRNSSEICIPAKQCPSVTVQ